MGAFGLWVIATVVWHAVQGTLPSAVAMGAVGSAALTANAISFGILWFHRMGDSNMRSAWIARVMTCSGIWRCCSRRLACSAPARGARPCGRRHHGNSCAAGCVHRAAITRRTASAQAHRGADHRTSYPQLVCAAVHPGSRSMIRMIATVEPIFSKSSPMPFSTSCRTCRRKFKLVYSTSSKSGTCRSAGSPSACRWTCA